MAAIRQMRCVTDDDLAAASLFMLEQRHELHPSITVMDTLTLLCDYMTHGHLMMSVNDRQAVIGISAYFLGTREKQFEDKEVVFIDVGVFSKAYRSGRQFYLGFSFMVDQIISEHPDVKELRLAALTDNRYLLRLYSKLAAPLHERESALGPETVFGAPINEISTTLKRYNQL